MGEVGSIAHGERCVGFLKSNDIDYYANRIPFGIAQKATHFDEKSKGILLVQSLSV